MKRLFVIVGAIFVACSTTPPQLPSPQSEPPQPIGGYPAIYKNLVYPEEAKETGIEGKVVIKAFIDSTGTVTETVVVQGFPNTGLDLETREARRLSTGCMGRDSPGGAIHSCRSSQTRNPRP